MAIGAVAGGMALASMMSGSGGGGGGGTSQAASIQRETLHDILDRLDQVEVPEAEDMMLALEDFEQVGELDPILVDAITQDPTAFLGITEDPQLEQRQKDVINRLTDISQAGGQDAQFRERMTEATLEGEAEARGAREAIMQRAQEQGTLTGGQQLAMQQSAEQAAAGRASQRGVSAAAEAERRALDALVRGGTMAGDVRQQEYGQQADIATARDAIARFNAQQGTRAEEQNVATRMGVQRENLGQAQNVADRNVQQRNIEAERRANIPRDIYGMEMEKASAATGAMQQTGSTLGQLYANQPREPDRMGQLMQLGGTVGAAYMSSDEDVKKDIEPLSEDKMDQLLADLTGSRYQYRKGSIADDGGENHVGIMADQLKRSDMGRDMVHEGPTGSDLVEVDMGTLLALIGRVNEKTERNNNGGRY